MGRIKKYQTEEERIVSIREKAMRYYVRNKAKCQQAALERYHKNKFNDSTDTHHNSSDDIVYEPFGD